jgi:tRNA-dihydrouridine synthase 3
VRKGYNDNNDIAHTFLPRAAEWGACAVTLHGRTRQQRYSRRADWDYIARCSKAVAPTGLQLIGNGDVFSYSEYKERMDSGRGDGDVDGPGGLATCMIARAALIKPWIFTEIKEQREWDISAGERLELLKKFCNAGLEHWGSDSKVVCRGILINRKFHVSLLLLLPI